MGESGFHWPSSNLKPSIYCDNLKLNLEYFRMKILGKYEFIDLYLRQNYVPTVKEMVGIIYMLMPLDIEESCLLAEEILYEKPAILASL